jgi:hypothetical protein
MNRQARIAALLIASMALVGGCKAASQAHTTRYTPAADTSASVAVPNPVGPARAARDAAAKANAAAGAEQQTIDDLTAP